MTHGERSDAEAICALKYSYLRLLDLKRFDELGELLTDGCTASYEDGRRAYEGRAQIVAFLSEVLSDPGMVTAHLGHHPEIEVTGDKANGTWYLTDRVVVVAADLQISGTALYHDRYLRVHGRWLIDHTGYERIFEEHRVHSTMALTSFRSRFERRGR